MTSTIQCGILVSWNLRDVTLSLPWYIDAVQSFRPSLFCSFVSVVVADLRLGPAMEPELNPRLDSIHFDRRKPLHALGVALLLLLLTLGLLSTNSSVTRFHSSNLHDVSTIHDVTTNTTLLEQQDSQVSTRPPPLPLIDETPQVLYNDIHYRRICARVGRATKLCLTIRLPFAYPLQEDNYTYPRPFSDDWYNLDRNTGLPILDGDDLMECRTNESLSSSRIDDDTVKACLDRHSTAETGAALFTRTFRNGTTHLFGTAPSTAPDQSSTRLWNFLGHNGVLLLAGASTTPGVYQCLLDLWGTCRDAGVTPRGSVTCTPSERRRLAYGMEHLENQDDLYVGVSHQYVAPQDDHKEWHSVDPNVSLVQTLGLRRPANWTTLRPLTILVDYALAHSQNHGMMVDHWNYTVSVAKDFAALIMNVASEKGIRELTEAGFELKHLIVFDGLPQTFPTETGGYVYSLHGDHSEAEFLKKGGYPGWYEELGSQCRGPLPRSSKLKELNDVARLAFEELGLDMAWYGRIWEFANMFWWQTNRYDRNGLDCTHSYAQRGGFYCMHRYFLVAMIDDYYDESR